MAIDFRDADSINELRYAGYLRILQVIDGNTYLGALLTVNVRGEPVEFIYNSVELNHPALWQGIDRERYAARRLVASLLKKCAVTPCFVLCLGSEIHEELFRLEVVLAVPVCRIQPKTGENVQPVPAADNQTGQTKVSFAWIPAVPEDSSAAQTLFMELGRRGMLTDPFERAAAGLLEAFRTRSAREVMYRRLCDIMPENSAGISLTGTNGRRCILGTPDGVVFDPGLLSVKGCVPADTAVSIVFAADSEKAAGAGREKSGPRPRASGEVPDQAYAVSLRKRIQRALRPSSDSILSESGPFTWAKPLFQYQIDGIRALMESENLLLADDMGLGKTIQALGALRILFLQRLIDAVLLIVPASLSPDSGGKRSIPGHRDCACPPYMAIEPTGSGSGGSRRIFT